MSSKIADEKPLTTDQARQLLAQEQQARVDAAKVELDAFVDAWCKKHRVRLGVSMLITERGNIPQLNIIAEA
jgi:hypothetical protein